MQEPNRRNASRLRLGYPIQLHAGGDAPGRLVGQTVTRDLSAGGAYFSTFDGGDYAVGQAIDVSITVPHRLAWSEQDVLLDLRATARIVRKDTPRSPRLCGEDGRALTGVALRFDDPLRFNYAWI